MTAFQSLEGYLNGSIFLVGFYLFIVESCCDVDTASATDNELTPNLGIAVSENVAVQFACWEIVGTIHACLFVGGNQALDRTMLQIF